MVRISLINYMADIATLNVALQWQQKWRKNGVKALPVNWKTI